MQSPRLAFFLLGATLALGFAFSAHQIATALVRMRQEHTIRVKGVAAENVTSDIGTWQGNFTVHAATLQESAATLATARDKVAAFLAAENIPLANLTFSAITTNEIMARDAKGQPTNEIQYYSLSQSVNVTSSDVQRIATLALRATDLIKDGVIMESGSPQYIFTGLEKLKLDLLAKATQNGYIRARALADNSNSHVGVLTSAEQGVFQITPLYSTETLDDGAYDTTTIEKSVKAVITLEYAVEK
jgi:hypothetical protein